MEETKNKTENKSSEEPKAGAASWLAGASAQIEEENKAKETAAEAAGAAGTAEDGSAAVKKSVYDGVDPVECVFIAAFVLMFVFTFILALARVSGPSMDDTLHDGDTMIVRKLDYEPEDGDIVVINCREANLINGDTGEVYQTGDTLDEFIVKRVIAKEGDTIDIDFTANKVTVNGTVLDETYTSSPILYDGGAFTYPLTVPEGYVFAMGDNRSVSLDSRDVRVGLVRKEMIYGKVLHSFKTLSPFAKKD